MSPVKDVKMTTVRCFQKIEDHTHREVWKTESSTKQDQSLIHLTDL